MTRLFPAILLLPLALPVRGAEPAPLDVAPLREVPVLDGGRAKPLDTFARDAFRGICGKAGFAGPKGEGGGDPVGLWVAVAGDPGRFGGVPMIEVRDYALKEALGVPEGTTHVSHASLAEKLADAGSAYRKLLAEAHAKQQAGKGDARSRLERHAEELHARWTLLDRILSGDAPGLVPFPGHAEGRWFARKDLSGLASAHRQSGGASLPAEFSSLLEAGERWDALLAAAKAGDAQAFRGAAASLAERSTARYEVFRASRPPKELWATADMIRREVLYQRLGLYGWAWGLYLLAFAAFLAGLSAGSGALRKAAYAVLAAGWLAHLGGFLLRFSIVGMLVEPGEMPRIPLSNLYEALTFVALGGVAIGLVFEAIYRTMHFGLVSALSGFAALVLATHLDFFDPKISPVVPALRSYWMNYHVSSMLLGYAAGMVAVGISHLHLFGFLRGRARSEWFERLDLYNYRAMQVAALFIGVGLVLGAVWAGESWGRWWGWDPKENWALVTFLAYVLTLHLRVLGVLGGLGTAVMGIVGFGLIFMTFYGVNLMGKGLHSYGWFEGGWAPLLLFYALEGALLAAVWIRRASAGTGRT